MEIRLLSANDFDKLFYTFKMAFMNNEVRFQPSEEEFSYRLKNKLNYSSDISAGIFDGSEMTGFIIHADNIYQGIPTAYNGGTGVLPGFRNQKNAEQMYEYLIPKIREKFLARIILEVTEKNEQAIALYEKIGFSIRRKFRCYKVINPIKTFAEAKITEGEMSDLDFDFNDFEPSFIDSDAQLRRGKEKVLVVEEDQKVVGYSIFQPHLGRISQLAVHPKYRNRGKGEALLAASQSKSEKPLTIMNIPHEEEGFDTFLKGCGFQNQVNQYEMELII